MTLYVQNDLPKRPIYVKRHLQKRPIYIKRDLYTSKDTYKRGLYISKENQRGRCAWRDDVSTCAKYVSIIKRDLQKRPVKIKRDLIRTLWVWWRQYMRQICVNHQNRPICYTHHKRPTKEVYAYQKKPREGVVCGVMTVVSACAKYVSIIKRDVHTHISVQRNSQKRPIHIKKDLKRALCVMWWVSVRAKYVINHQRRPIWQIHRKRPTKEAYKDQKRPDQDVVSVIMSVHAPNMWKSSKETYIPMYVKTDLQKRPIIIKRDLYTSKKI